LIEILRAAAAMDRAEEHGSDEKGLGRAPVDLQPFRHSHPAFTVGIPTDMKLDRSTEDEVEVLMGSNRDGLFALIVKRVGPVRDEAQLDEGLRQVMAAQDYLSADTPRYVDVHGASMARKCTFASPRAAMGNELSGQVWIAIRPPWSVAFVAFELTPGIGRIASPMTESFVFE